MADEQKKISFKDTLNLPKTSFPIRPNAKDDDPTMITRWDKENLYGKAFAHNKGSQEFILHDGPPYANGQIHIGHAYNKVLKDIITKSQRMMGKHVPFTPGWDCHGLPIELKVSAENTQASKIELQQKCRAWAQKWVDIQAKEMKRLGVIADWQNPYLTMNYQYQAAILEVFGKFVDDGYITRKNKTVPWCFSCKTVLASAEIEYQDRKDPSIYVLFQLQNNVVKQIIPDATLPAFLVVWTTTPWTLPLNRAVLVKPNTSYAVVRHQGKLLIFGNDLVDQLCAKLEIEKDIVGIIDSSALVDAHAKVQHPFIDNLLVPIIADSSVSTDDGTACVHCAPGAGPIDYEVGIRNKLAIFSSVQADGRYDDTVMPRELHGKSITDAQGWVIKTLLEHDRLLHKASIRHSYPHCWRCRNGLIFRATRQWFLQLNHNDLQQRALDAIDKITMYPQSGQNRFTATVQGRLEWCLSRQRTWGIPIPALINIKTDEFYLSTTLIEKVIAGIQQQGVEWWQNVPVDELVAGDDVFANVPIADLRKEMDILDVWFDAGISHYAVLQKRDDLHVPADLYLEGSDQHRGWFQSSLLTSMALNGIAPMKQILTHGFVVDAKGHKMSKSLGNVVSPQELIDQLGTDGLRMWVASLEYQKDMVLSPVLIKNVQQVFRKVRNTLRFLLSNLYDFSIDIDALPLNQLKALDQYALHRLSLVNSDILHKYETFDITGVLHALADYCTTELSSFYLDMSKDRLYVEQANGRSRRSAQTACWYILDVLTRLTSPIMSFTAEQVSDLYQKDKDDSIHLQTFVDLPDIFALRAEQEHITPKEQRIINRFTNLRAMVEEIRSLARENELVQLWHHLDELRDVVLKAIEKQRAKKVIKHSLEARVTLSYALGSDAQQRFTQFRTMLSSTNENLLMFLKEFFIVSQIEVVEKDVSQKTPIAGLSVEVVQARGEKCPRCWQWNEVVHEHNLCDRCFAIVSK